MEGVGADVGFVADRFPNLGLHSHADDDDFSSSPSPSEVVARESALLLAQRERLSVRDLASKFEKGFAAAHAAAAKASDETKFRDALLLDRQALLKKLRGLLETLVGRVAGRNKDDMEEALTLVEALTVQLVHRETELAQEKADARKMASLFKQASDDARKMVEEARAVAHSEIETARASARRVEAAFQEESKRWSTSEKKELEDMRLEVQEARRIKMLHESSKAMDMEHIIDGLKHQVAEKSSEILKLRKELEVLRQHEEESKLYQLQGAECLGSSLQITALNEAAPQIAMCSIKWYRVSSDGIKAELISGATRSQYAPEPFDVGRIVRVDISLPDGRNQTLCTSGPIDPAPGLGPFVEALTHKGGADFHVIIVQQNAELVEKQSLYVLNIGRMRIKLHKGRTTKVKEHYTPAMQLCGARGGGEAAALCLFWIAKKGQSFMLGFESERERNAAIMLARRFAFDCNVMLAGPDDRAPLGT